MKFTYHFVFVVFYVSVARSSIYTNLKENVLTYLKGIQKAPPRPEQGRQFDDDQTDFHGNAEDNKNPTSIEFVRVEPKQEPVNDDVQLTIDTKVQNLESGNTVDSTHLQPKQDTGIDTEKVTERIEKWATKHSTPQKDLSLNLNKAIRDLVLSQLQFTVDPKDAELAKIKSNILRNAKKQEDRLNMNLDLPKIEAVPKLNSQYFHMDPVLNMLRSHSYRRKSKTDDDSSSSSSSSSMELREWKEEFQQEWLHKKYEALNQTRPKGDTVNMVAARPWGVHCGDPAQHDMPWGTCMLAAECEPEFRIYRGDIYCGRSEFVCCSLQVTNYDMYQGFDVSFDDKSLSTDTEEKKRNDKSSSEKKKKKDAKEKRKREKARRKRKKKIKKTIKKIVKEVRKALDKQFKNGTKERKKRTRQLKKFIKKLKKQYKKDRQSVKDLHEKDMIHIDNNLLIKLRQIKAMNKNFMKNETFREIVVNGTMSKQGARMLLEAYPELDAYLNTGRRAARRSLDDTLEYDIEYGFLYY